MNETYNKIVEDITRIAEMHNMVERVDHGEISKLISTRDYKYPLIYFLNEYVRENADASVVVYKMHILACSSVQNGEGDMLEVQSDMLQILMDICNILQNHKYFRNTYKIVDNIVYFPFFERFDDNITGYRAEVYIQAGLNKNPCQAPFNWNDDINNH